MAMTAWSAKVVSSSICVSVKGIASTRTIVDGADRRVAAQHRHGNHAAVTDRLGTLGDVRVLGAALGVSDCDDTTLENRLGGDALPAR